MRGISESISRHTAGVRFNPAYAGNIEIVAWVEQKNQVQPRVCGEYCIFFIDFVFLSGSTPRMRGIFNFEKEKKRRIRFNPAYAGNMISELYSVQEY